jgi:hypothetical protein
MQSTRPDFFWPNEDSPPLFLSDSWPQRLDF